MPATTVDNPGSVRALNHLMDIVCGYVTAQALITSSNALSNVTLSDDLRIVLRKRLGRVRSPRKST